VRFVGILFAVPLLAASIAFAGAPWIVTGRVVGISDGDTIAIYCPVGFRLICSAANPSTLNGVDGVILNKIPVCTV
jgi:hypothetical protein